MTEKSFRASDIKLKTHAVLSELIQPVSSREYEDLELNLIEYGCREPIIVWNNYILDGHKRYKICAEYNIPFTILVAGLSHLAEAVSFVCENQLKRVDLEYARYKYLVGKWALMQRDLARRDSKLSKQTDKPVSVQSAIHKRRLAIAAKLHLAPGTVNKYRDFTEAADKISVSAPELGRRIISGRIRISHDNTLALAGRTTEELKNLELSVTDGDITYLTRDTIRHEIMLFGYERRLREKAADKKAEKGQAQIKNMPKYDPDAEISSLAFTVPSWCNVIARTRKAANLSLASRKAKERLAGQLLTLRSQAELLLDNLKEFPNE